VRLVSGWLPEDDFVNHFAADVDPVGARVMYAVQRAPRGIRPSGRDGYRRLRITPSWYLVADGIR